MPVDRRVLVYACRLAMAQESREAVEEARVLALQCDAAEAELQAEWDDVKLRNDEADGRDRDSGKGHLSTVQGTAG